MTKLEKEFHRAADTYHREVGYDAEQARDAAIVATRTAIALAKVGNPSRWLANADMWLGSAEHANEVCRKALAR